MKRFKEIKEMCEVLLSEKASQAMFVVVQGSKYKVLGQFKDKRKAIDLMKKNPKSKIVQIGKFATVDGKPVDIKVGDEMSYTRFKMSTKIKEEANKNIKRTNMKKFKEIRENVDEGLGNSTPNVKKKTGIGTDGTVFNIPGKKPGSVFHVKPRLDGNTLKFGTVNNFGDIKVMTIKELEKVLR